MKKPVIDAWIFARGGSKGLPGKNIKPLDGKPLIAYSIEAGKKSRYINNIYVSTDSPDIAAAAEQYGAIVPFLRPAELAGDRSPERLAWRHAVNWSRTQTEYPKMDVFVSLLTTCPFKTGEEIDGAIELFLKGGCDTVIGLKEMPRQPSCNMFYLSDQQDVGLVIPPTDWSQYVANRQAHKMAYGVTGFYVSDLDFIMNVNNYLEGRVKGYVISEIHGLDIDNLHEFRYAEFLIDERKKGLLDF